MATIKNENQNESEDNSNSPTSEDNSCDIAYSLSQTSLNDDDHGESVENKRVLTRSMRRRNACDADITTSVKQGKFIYKII